MGPCVCVPYCTSSGSRLVSKNRRRVYTSTISSYVSVEQSIRQTPTVDIVFSFFLPSFFLHKKGIIKLIDISIVMYLFVVG